MSAAHTGKRTSSPQSHSGSVFCEIRPRSSMAAAMQRVEAFSSSASVVSRPVRVVVSRNLKQYVVGCDCDIGWLRIGPGAVCPSTMGPQIILAVNACIFVLMHVVAGVLQVYQH